MTVYSLKNNIVSFGVVIIVNIIVIVTIATPTTIIIFIHTFHTTKILITKNACTESWWLGYEN